MLHAGTLLIVLAACAPESRPFIAEIFYDAAGDDSGLEFVELFNPTPATHSLAGLRLEAGDGSGPQRWTLRWTGGAADTIGPRGRFVIGGASVAPPPQALAALDLQNGPDAVRLVWPDRAIEVVGYGAHEFAEYACGEPATDAPSGSSLARVPDDAQRGSNALDFRALGPSPGRANQPTRDVGWVPAGLVLRPEHPGVGEPSILHGRIENRGTEAAAAPSMRVLVMDLVEGAASQVADLAVPGSLGPGDTVAVEAALPTLVAGTHTLRMVVAWVGDEVATNDADSVRVRVGPGPLELTEIQFHPSGGEGEWVEVRNRSGGSLALERFTLSDRGATVGRLDVAEELPAESLAVLAQDPSALMARHPGLDPRRVRLVKPWPSLNNSDGAEGFADLAVLRDGEGLISDRHAYSAAGVPNGVPLERHPDGAWWPALHPEGTPLEPPRRLPELSGGFDVRPRRITLGEPDLRFSWSLPWTTGRVAIDAYDMGGTRIGTVMSERAVPARGEQRWSVAGMPPGLYFFVLRARADRGAATLLERRPVRVAGNEP